MVHNNRRERTGYNRVFSHNDLMEADKRFYNQRKFVTQNNEEIHTQHKTDTQNENISVCIVRTIVVDFL